LFVVALVGAEGGDLTNGRMFAQQPAPSANANSTDASQFSCAAADARLRACFTFDGDTKDRSSYGNHANSANVSYVPGKAESRPVGDDDQDVDPPLVIPG
jgi:hypothetical protein